MGMWRWRKALCSCFTVLDVPVSQSSHRGIWSGRVSSIVSFSGVKGGVTEEVVRRYNGCG